MLRKIGLLFGGKYLKNKYKILAISVALIVFAVSVFYVVNQPPSIETLKKTPENFRFEYLYNYQTMQEALSAILYEGMPRAELEEVFVDIAGAKGNENGIAPRRLVYSKPIVLLRGCLIQKGPASWRFIVQYDEEMLLQKFKTKQGKEVLFRLMPQCF